MKSMSKYDGKWCVGVNSTTFTGSFDTRQEAIKEGDGCEYHVFYIGKCKEEFEPYIHADDIIDQLQAEAYDAGGEHSEDYLRHIPKERVDELENGLNKIFQKWVSKYKYEVNFYSVSDVEKKDRREFIEKEDYIEGMEDGWELVPFISDEITKKDLYKKHGCPVKNGRKRKNAHGVVAPYKYKSLIQEVLTLKKIFFLDKGIPGVDPIKEEIEFDDDVTVEKIKEQFTEWVFNEIDTAILDCEEQEDNMKIYNITITKTTEFTGCVQANSEEEAERLMLQRFEQEEPDDETTSVKINSIE